MAGNPFPSKTRGGSATATTDSRPAQKLDGDDDNTTDADSGSDPIGIGGGGDPFAIPSGPSDYKISDFLHELLLVCPTEVDTMVTKVSGKDGPSEFVRVDVVRLDNNDERVDDMLVFQEALRRTLKKVMRGANRWALGRLELGENKKGNPPYILVKPEDEADIQRARDAYRRLGLKG